ncbi:DUF305 domain-containing protein [Sphaerisporangium krabiense]|uniref:Uncharacterized protein (DUF305 family) n=1 Tax=Sphaerisporangium krabiense TaxID=763782 RepID=A0A7W9DNR4_9ACTN|nr:DUF305 domain-containing protein [Sphaerisporangium krabiense]MBB5625612.1 uncharacterized protein (DUF305 family) [Sphaerisporangium krabiense]
MKRFITVPAALVAAGVLVTGCGAGETGQESQAGGGHMSPTMSPTTMPSTMPSGMASAMPSAMPTGTPSPPYSGQDVMFAQMMIPHHRQAVEMAGLAASRTAGAEVKRLAERIEAAQEPEITAMSGWLADWDMPVAHDMASMGHDMQGMMSDGDMRRLKGMSGTAFDRAFLQMMIEHHEGAISMAEQERTAGSFAPARTMAASIVESQKAEIATMRRLLGRK